MQARIIGETEAHQEEPLGAAYTDCRETVRRIFRREPLLLEACLDEEEELAVHRAVGVIREGWSTFTEFLKDIDERYVGEVRFSDLRPEEAAEVRMSINDLRYLIGRYRRVCWELGTSSL